MQVRPHRYRILHEVTDLSTKGRYRFIHRDMNPSTRYKIVHKDTDLSTKLLICPLRYESVHVKTAFFLVKTSEVKYLISKTELQTVQNGLAPFETIC